jgi:hypothetical protein
MLKITNCCYAPSRGSGFTGSTGVLPASFIQSSRELGRRQNASAPSKSRARACPARGCPERACLRGSPARHPGEPLSMRVSGQMLFGKASIEHPSGTISKVHRLAPQGCRCASFLSTSYGLRADHSNSSMRMGVRLPLPACGVTVVVK